MNDQGYMEIPNIVTEHIVINRHFHSRLIPVTADKKSIDAINKAMEEGAQALTELERLQERDTAKKVIKGGIDYERNCPTCKEFALNYDSYGELTEKPCFCPHCGQRLDWGE